MFLYTCQVIEATFEEDDHAFVLTVNIAKVGQRQKAKPKPLPAPVPATPPPPVETKPKPKSPGEACQTSFSLHQPQN